MVATIQILLVATILVLVAPLYALSSISKEKSRSIDFTNLNTNTVGNNAKSKVISNNNYQIEPANINSDIIKHDNINGVLIQSIDVNSDYNNDDEVDDDENDNKNNDHNELSSLSSDEQIKLLSKQLEALTQKRREDYQLLENNLKKYFKKNLISVVDEDVRKELEHLR